MELQLSLEEIEIIIEPDVLQNLKDLFPAGSICEHKDPEVNQQALAVNQQSRFSNLFRCFSRSNRDKIGSVEFTVTTNGNANKYSGAYDSNVIPTGKWKLKRGKDPEISIKFREKDKSFIEDTMWFPEVFLGECTFKNSDKYEGEWKDGKLNGKGKYTYPDGGKYEGEFLDDKFHGHGIYTYANGRKYEGDWKDGKRDGKGTFTYPDGGKYEGEWKYGEIHGQGKYTYKNGDIYEGEFKDGERNGKGTLTYANGGKYEGDWQGGAKHGKGTFTYPDGGKYEGEWQYGARHGKGTFTYPDGGKYEGEWQDDARHGKGKYTYPDGDKYEGEFLDDKFHGHGIYTYPDGGKYEGEFKEDKMMMSSNKSKEKNKIPTLLLRSSEMNEGNRSIKYENDKFLDGDKPVKAVVCEDSKAVLTKVNQFIKENPTEENSKCRIVFDQHGGEEGYNNMSIDSESAKEILKNLASAGFKEIIISDLACHGGTAYHFLKVAQDFVNEHKVIVKVRFAPKDRVCIDGIKVHNNDEKRFTTMTLGTDGSGKPRELKMFTPESANVGNPELANLKCKEEEKNSKSI